MNQIKFETFKVEKLPELTIDQVSSVYVGKPHTCMCGCAGTYTYTKKSQEQAGKNRGYEVTDDEVNDARVQRVINKMKKNEANGVEVIDSNFDNNWILTVVIGKTQYTIYTAVK